MKKRWNISMLVMFVLLACSLLGLLSVYFLRNMATQYDQIMSYYKTYYLAQAGIETALVQLHHRGLWYSETIDATHPLIIQNINQPKSSFSFTIRGESNFLSKSLLDSGSCLSPFILHSGQSLILPLFVDGFTWSIIKSLYAWLVNQNLWTMLPLLQPVSDWLVPWTVNMWILLADSTGLYENGMYFSSGTDWNQNFFSSFSQSADRVLSKLEDIRLQNNNWQTDKNFSPYLIIANKDFRTVKFCLQLPNGKMLPTQQYLIQSFGMFGTSKLWLEATYKQPIPSFLIDSSFR